MFIRVASPVLDVFLKTWNKPVEMIQRVARERNSLQRCMAEVVPRYLADAKRSGAEVINAFTSRTSLSPSLSGLTILERHLHSLTHSLPVLACEMCFALEADGSLEDRE